MNPSSQASLSRLDEIVGGEHFSMDEAEVRACEVCGVAPSAVVRPADANQVAEIMRFAASEKLAVIPIGGGTKLGIGAAPSRYDIALDLCRMNRVLAYDPHDLTLGVEPGVRIEDLLRTLAEQRQFLPLAVPFLDRATIGGIVTANASSPLRHAYGAVRDFCLGMEFVTGEGARAKSGGRVVKNVTGYDLHKLLIGSLGTLGVITRVNFRTFPLLPAQGTFTAAFSTAQDACEFCATIAHSFLVPQIVEIADSGAAQFLFPAQDEVGDAMARRWSVIVSAAGQTTVVERHMRELGRLAHEESAVSFTTLADGESVTLLTRIREFPRMLLESTPSALIFRINVMPTAIPSILVELERLAGGSSFALTTLTRASGIVYAAFVPANGNGEASRAAQAQLAKKVLDLNAKPEANAQAMLEWCPDEVKRLTGDPWGPPREDLALMRKVKDAFDPQRVLSPGRFAGAI